MAITDLCWLRKEVPPEAKAFWQEAYPAMAPINERLSIIRANGYQDIANFVLSESAWWNDYYGPLESRLPPLKSKYKANPFALHEISETQREIEMYRKYSYYYGYVFFVMQKLGV
jgi:hypothetical protein